MITLRNNDHSQILLKDEDHSNKQYTILSVLKKNTNSKSLAIELSRRTYSNKFELHFIDLIYDQNCNKLYEVSEIDINEIDNVIDQYISKYSFTSIYKSFLLSAPIRDKSLFTYKHHILNLYDKDINIVLTNTSTIFGINILLNGMYLNIYKKIPFNSNNIISSVTETFIKYKSRAKDEISKMSEFIYENSELIFNLVKLKALFNKTNVDLKKNINKSININVNEINNFRKIDFLSKQECTKSFDLINCTNKELNIFKSMNSVRYIRLKSKLSSFTHTNNHIILNKQNFENVSQINLKSLFPVIGNTKNTYIINNNLIISNFIYNKIINFNKYLNYYYYKKDLNNFKNIIVFDKIIEQDNLKFINNIFILNLNKSTVIKYYIKTFVKIQNNYCLYICKEINDEYNINNIIKKNIYDILVAKETLENISNVISFKEILFISSFISKLHRHNTNTMKFINCSSRSLNFLKKIFDNIEYNKTHNFEKIIEFLNNNFISIEYDYSENTNLFDYFIEEYIMKGLLPIRLKKQLNKAIAINNNTSDLHHPLKRIIELNNLVSNWFDSNHYLGEDNKLYINENEYNNILFLINRKYDDKTLQELKELVPILMLRVI